MPQSLSQLYVHLVFSTKHREPMLLSPVREELHAYLAAVLNNRDSPALKVGVRVGMKKIVPPLQGCGLMGVLLTQAFSLGFVRSPLWGSWLSRLLPP